jgi:hypothetical protein
LFENVECGCLLLESDSENENEDEDDDEYDSGIPLSNLLLVLLFVLDFGCF